MGTVAGVIVAALLLDLSQLGAASDLAAERREAGIVGLFASTYIGGSVNYAALGEITGLSQDASFFSAATAADNLFSAVFLSVIALIPGAQWLTRRFVPHTASSNVVLEKPEVTPASIVYSLAAAGSIVAVTDLLCWWLDIPSWRYAIMTLITVASRLRSSVRFGLPAHSKLALRSPLPFCAIAAGADIRAMISVAPLLIVLVLILLSVHLIVLLAVAGDWA